MGIGAVVVHFEAPEDLAECIDSMRGGTTVPDIVVVDNSLDPALLARGERVCADAGVAHLSTGTNLGFAAGVNLGAAHFPDTIDQLLFVNPDARLHSDTIAKLSETLNEAPDLGAVNPTIYLPDDTIWFGHGSLQPTLGRIIQHTDQPLGAGLRGTDWVNGCVLLVRREAFDAVGGLDDGYFMYWEDIVFSLRLIEANWRIGVRTDASAVHLRGRDGLSMDAISLAQLEHSMASRLRFVQRELDGRDRVTASAYTAVNAIRLAQRGMAAGAGLTDVVRAVGRGLRGGLS